MQTRSGSALTRFIVTAWLLLAVSPVTAPFLTFDLRDLPGDATSRGVALLQAKTANDEPVSTVAISAVFEVCDPPNTVAPTTAVRHVSRRLAFQTPLRI